MKRIIIISMILALIVSGCSLAEPARIGESDAMPVYVDITEITTVNITQPIILSDYLIAYGQGIDLGTTGWIEGGSFYDYFWSSANAGWDFYTKGTDNESIARMNLESGADIVDCTWSATIHKGFSADNPEFTNFDITGFSGLLLDDQHILDAEAISAIENAVALVLPAGFYFPDATVHYTGYEIDIDTTNLAITSHAQTTGLYWRADVDTHLGVQNVWKLNSASPADNDYIFREFFRGNDSVGGEDDYASRKVLSVDVTSGTEDGLMEWYLKYNGSENKVMYITSDGTLYTDLAPQVFDDYDDVKLLKEGFSGLDYEKLKNAGILVNVSDNSTPDYMINVQNMSFLLAGATIQNRDIIERLEKRIQILEGK